MNPSPAQKKFYLEDLHVGQKFSGGAPVLIDSAQSIEFARQFDPQSFHLDSESAKNSIFGQLVSSGWQTAAVSMRMLVTGDLQIENGLIGTSGEISWPVPVYPGDTLSIQGEIIEISPPRAPHNRGRIKIKGETFNQNGQVVQRLVASLLVLSRPA